MNTKKLRIRKLTRTEMVQAACPEHYKVTTRQARLASEVWERYGYVHAAPAFGPCREQVVMVPKKHPLGPIVEAVREGQGVFPAVQLEQAVGAVIDSKEAMTRLAKVGLAVAGARDDLIKLGPANPDAAAIVNARRLGPTRGGTLIRNVVEAFAPGVPVKKLGPARLLEAGAAMEQWGLASPNLLDRTPRVHVISSWVFPCW